MTLKAAPSFAETSGGKTTSGSVIKPSDPRYFDLSMGNNVRFVAKPDYVHMVSSAEDAKNAVQTAVDNGKKVSIRSGGHCWLIVIESVELV